MSTQRTSRIKHAKHPYISVNPEICGGSPIISGTRIRVIDIAIEYDRLGFTPDQIVDAHPHLNLESVHDSFSYYYENRDSIDKIIREKKQVVKRVAQKTPSILKKIINKKKYGVGDLIRKLKLLWDVAELEDFRNHVEFL